MTTCINMKIKRHTYLGHSYLCILWLSNYEYIRMNEQKCKIYIYDCRTVIKLIRVNIVRFNVRLKTFYMKDGSFKYI